MKIKFNNMTNNFALFIFNLATIIKTKLFLISLSIFYLIYAIVIYLLPSILKITIFELMDYKGMIMSLNMILSIISIYNVILLFKKSQIDGSALIILTKPIKRWQINFNKLLCLFLINTLISIGTVIISLFLLINNSHDVSIKGVILGAFFGPLISGMFWTAITLVVCLVLNYSSIFFSAFAIVMLVSMWSNVATIVNKYPSQIAKKTNIDSKDVQLISNDNQIKKLTLATYDNLAINKNTIIDNESISDYIKNLNETLSTVWTNAVNESDVRQWSYTDIASLLASFYNVSINNWSIPHKSDFKSYQTFEQTSRFYYPVYTPLKNLDEVLNNNRNFKVNENNYYLVNISNKDYLSEVEMISLPTFDKNINFEINEKNLKKFATTYFNQELINKLINSYIYWTSHSSNDIEISSMYYSLFASYWLNEYNISVVQSYKNDDYKNDVEKSIFYFQYYTFLFIADYYNNPSNYSNFINVNNKNLILNVSLNVLNQSNLTNNVNLPNRSIKHDALLMKLDNYLNFINHGNIDMLPDILIQNITKQFNAPLTFLTKNNLITLSSMQIHSLYDFKIAIPVILIMSITLSIIATAVLNQKDEF